MPLQKKDEHPREQIHQKVGATENCMITDSSKWDQKYQRSEHGNSKNPDPLLVQYSSLFRKGDNVIDLACGTGRNAVFLAGLGCSVIAVDCSKEALQRCNDFATSLNLAITTVEADLTVYRFNPLSVDAIVCFNFLNREIAGNLQAALKPGGILLHKTFNQNFSLVKPKFNPDYMLAPKELSRLYRDLEIVAIDDDCEPASTTMSYLIGKKSQ